MFETEHGSIYFVFSDGSTLRFKKKDDGFQRQYVMEHIFYLEPDVKKEIQGVIEHGTAQAWLMNREIKCVSGPGNGLSPFELVVHGSRVGEFEVERTRDDFKVVPGERYTQLTGEEPQFYAGYHLGHEISKVVSQRE